MYKDNEFTHKRKIVSLSSSGGVIRTQSQRFAVIGSEADHVLNSRGNRRGMSEASKEALRASKPGFGESSQRNLQKCLDIFFWSLNKSHGLNPITKKEGFLSAAFITLTIPDLHTKVDSKVGYERLLKEFMRWVCRRFGIDSYVWKFEWQTRGQGHWHIFVNAFCEQDVVRAEWLRRLGKLGLTKDWLASHDYDSPYSCKIKGLKDEKQVREYMMKYMYKDSQNEETTEGRAWGASLWIKKSKSISVPVTDKFLQNLEQACERNEAAKWDVEIEKSEKEKFKVATVFEDLKRDPRRLLCPEQLIWWNAYIRAYRTRNWEETHRLEYWDEKVIEDSKRWNEWRDNNRYIREMRTRRQLQLEKRMNELSSSRSEDLQIKLRLEC